PTHGIPAEVYHKGWARNGGIVNDSTHSQYGYHLNLKHNFAQQYGGPLFWAHYSFVGLDPRNLKDKYADYWQENRNHTLINRQWCIENPKGYKGYGENCWGLTASYSTGFYAAHRPMDEDLGVITPTAALSSFPYTPEESMKVMKHLYFDLGDKVWGEYGFYDAFSEQKDWYVKWYLAIDQGPEVVMIENHRSGLLWDLFMSAPEVQSGLDKLGFTY
ncbi:MAG: glucoamylase family protein, partial [Imperialibacter sp.]